jgi:DNA repair exonuclease SbcCD nuclease subunit
MKICITSDQHWHIFKEFDRLTSDGLSFRLSLYEKSLNYVHEYCVINNISTWIDAGDLFHSRESISIPVLDALSRTLNRFKMQEENTCSIKKFFLMGNHDTYNKIGNITSLHFLEQYGEVITEDCILNLEQFNFPPKLVHFIPWDEKTSFVDLINKNEKTNLVIAHRMLNGAKNGNFILQGENILDLDLNKFDYAFIGHVHGHQRINDKICYIGSLISNNFNDVDQEKGFLIILNTILKLKYQI